MEIGQRAVQKGIMSQPVYSNPIDTLKEGQIFTGKMMKLLPGHTAEVAAFGQKIKARLEVPLQEGEKYFFQVASLKNGMQLKVISSKLQQQRFQNQEDFLLDKLQLPKSNENKAYLSLAIEAGKPISKENIQMGASWLVKSGLEDGLKALRFMFTHQLPVTENVFQSLISARSPQPLTEALAFLQQLLQQNGHAPKTAATISRLLDKSLDPTQESFLSSKALNEKVIQLTQSLATGNSVEKGAAIRELQNLLQLPAPSSAASIEAQLAATLKNLAASRNAPEKPVTQPAIDMLKKAIVELAVRPVTPETISAFQKAVLSALPLDHPDRPAIMQQAVQLTETLVKGVPAETRQTAAFLLFALRVAAAVPGQAAARVQHLLGKEAEFFEEAASGKIAAAAMRDAFRVLGIDHEAAILTQKQLDATQQNVKQELLKLMADSLPLPIKETAGQLLGRLNAQHILSAEAGPLLQLVMQVPLQLAEFKGDITIKWQGKKQANNKIDADFCRVLFYVDMQQLKNTVIDMQIQNRIINVSIITRVEPSVLKPLSESVMEKLKHSLEQHGYALSGVQFKKPSDQEKINLPPLAQIMDEEAYLEVDIRI